MNGKELRKNKELYIPHTKCSDDWLVHVIAGEFNVPRSVITLQTTFPGTVHVVINADILSQDVVAFLEKHGPVGVTWIVVTAGWKRGVWTIWRNVPIEYLNHPFAKGFLFDALYRRIVEGIQEKMEFNFLAAPGRSGIKGNETEPVDFHCKYLCVPFEDDEDR